jgi:hypothetical protein
MPSHFDQWLHSKGVQRQFSTPHIHQQNGRAERLNQTIHDKAESMRLFASCPQIWWEFSYMTALHVYNRTPLRRTNWTTPYENMFNKKPDVHYFKVFGSLAWVYLPKPICKNKLQPKSVPMTFIGYDIGAKAYKFMKRDNTIFIGAHALFDETEFPKAKNENTLLRKSPQKNRKIPVLLQMDSEEESTVPTIPNTSNFNIVPENLEHDSSDTSEEAQPSSEESSGFESAEEENSNESEDEIQEDLQPSSAEESRGRRIQSTSNENLSTDHESSSEDSDTQEQVQPLTQPQPELR